MTAGIDDCLPGDIERRRQILHSDLLSASASEAAGERAAPSTQLVDVLVPTFPIAWAGVFSKLSEQ